MSLSQETEIPSRPGDKYDHTEDLKACDLPSDEDGEDEVRLQS